MLLDRGISNWFRRGLVMLLVALLIAGTAIWARQTMAPPAIKNFADWSEWRDYLRVLLDSPPLSYLLFPFRLVLKPYLATSIPDFGKSFIVALGIMAAHYLWVLRSNVAFEEASLKLSQRIAEKIAAVRAGKGLDGKLTKGSRAPFTLEPIGFAPIALFWKNLISAKATFRIRTIVLILLPFIIVMFATSRISSNRGGLFMATASMIALMCYVWSLFIGSQFVRCDFRRDLAAMDVLKLLPLRGWQVVAGELLAPVAILSVVQWLLLGVLAIFTVVGANTTGVPRLPAPWIVAAAVLTPFWNGLVLLIPNAAVLFFPSWFQTRADAPQGIEVMGQRLLLLFGQFIVIGVTIVPAALAFAAGFVPLHFAGIEMFAPIVGAAIAAVALAGETALGVFLVGKLFDRFDLAVETNA
jgi:hypothetical protein